MPVELKLKRKVGRPSKEDAKAHTALQDLLKTVETVPELVEILQEGIVRRNQRRQADEMENADQAQVNAPAQANQVPDAAPPWMQALLNQMATQGQMITNQGAAIIAIQQELQDRKEAGGSGGNARIDPPPAPDPSVTESSSESETDSEEEDYDERRQRRHERREKRREKRRLRREKRREEMIKGTGKGKSSTKSPATVTTSRDAPALARRSTKDVSNEEYCDYLEQLAQDCYEAEKDKWGPCPVMGYGNNLTQQEKPPMIGPDATGPQFEMWIRKWRFHVERNAQGVHPKLMGDFLRNQLQNACTDELWLWVENMMKGATAGQILRGLRERVFSKCNMAGTFLDVVQTPQSEMQTAEQLIMENDTTINHFKLAYPDRDDGMGIFLLMARLKNKRLRDKVTTMQDRPYNEICKQIIEFDQQYRQSDQLHSRITGSSHREVYQASAQNPGS